MKHFPDEPGKQRAFSFGFPVVSKLNFSPESVGRVQTLAMAFQSSYCSLIPKYCSICGCVIPQGKVCLSVTQTPQLEVLRSLRFIYPLFELLETLTACAFAYCCTPQLNINFLRSANVLAFFSVNFVEVITSRKTLHLLFCISVTWRPVFYEENRI